MEVPGSDVSAADLKVGVLCRAKSGLRVVFLAPSAERFALEAEVSFRMEISSSIRKGKSTSGIFCCDLRGKNMETNSFRSKFKIDQVYIQQLMRKRSMHKYCHSAGAIY